MTAPDAVLRRVKRNAGLLGVLGAALSFLLFGARPGLSLTIGAGIVILNFLVLEQVMNRVLSARTGTRLSDFVFPAGGALVIFLLIGGISKWKGFDLAAGLAGFSVVVVAIAWEGVRGGKE